MINKKAAEICEQLPFCMMCFAILLGGLHELTAKLDVLQEKAQSVKETADKAQQFLGFVRKYTELEELDAKILNELL